MESDFIEVKALNGRTVLINMNHVVTVTDVGNHTEFFLSGGGRLTALEPFDTLFEDVEDE